MVVVLDRSGLLATNRKMAVSGDTLISFRMETMNFPIVYESGTKNLFLLMVGTSLEVVGCLVIIIGARSGYLVLILAASVL